MRPVFLQMLANLQATRSTGKVQRRRREEHQRLGLHHEDEPSGKPVFMESTAMAVSR
jgi:hypothetical protein